MDEERSAGAQGAWFELKHSSKSCASATGVLGVEAESSYTEVRGCGQRLLSGCSDWLGANWTNRDSFGGGRAAHAAIFSMPAQSSNTSSPYRELHVHREVD
jgi:hypothetical protein